MNRRNFLRSMLGVAAATALPSEVFPFRKIFLPENPKPIDPYTWAGLARSPYLGRLATPLFSRQVLEEEVFALQLEQFAKEIPDLFISGTALYRMFKRPQFVVTEVDQINRTITMAPADEIRMPLQYLDANLKPSNLIHAPATPENIMEFIDGLEDDLS